MFFRQNFAKISIFLHSKKISIFLHSKNFVLGYALKCATDIIISRAFRNELLKLLHGMYEKTLQEGGDPDYVGMCKCMFLLNKPDELAQILHNVLLKEDEKSILTVFQIAFDIAENESQTFQRALLNSPLLKVKKPAPEPVAPAEGAEGEQAPLVDEKFEKYFGYLARCEGEFCI